MMEGRLIICIANAWDYDPTSKHHVMRILAERNEIIWVNYRGTRRPRLTGADVRAASSALCRCFAGPTRVAPSVVQISPLVLPGATRLRWLHERMVLSSIRRAIDNIDPRHRRPVQVWTFAPDVPFLCDRFGEECFVYYCVDEYREFKDLDAARIAHAEDELLRRADVVVTTSQNLHQTKRGYRPDAVLVRHGVDYEHFASAWRAELNPPRDVAQITRPIFGFFGLIGHWIDVQLLAAVARLRPRYSFVVMGDHHVNVSELRRQPNVHLLGRRPYQALPAYCASFHAGLLPFVRNSMTRNINPIKMLEYLAAGMPVVSTTLPEAQRFAGPIVFGDTPDRFAAACDQVLAHASPAERAGISALVAGETWSSRVALLSDVVTAHVARAERTNPGVLQGSPAQRPFLQLAGLPAS
jgi:glycosyltransferase involved in cell wall biosynthesis